MPTTQIVRYPNRRFYSRSAGRYLSLADIEELVRAGQTLEIHDSQTDEDLTRPVLARLIIDRNPEKMRLFPVDMLHAILRSNETMAEFLRDYFRHSLTYLDYLQRHSPAGALAQPMHWVKAWLDGLVPPAPAASPPPADEARRLAQRVAELEDRIRQLEAARTASAAPAEVSAYGVDR